MNSLMLDLLPAIRQGYCCSQLLQVLAEQLKGEEDPGLMRALRGLCVGIGYANGPCGLLTGGAAVLAWLAGEKDGAPHPMLEALLNDYAAWFMERIKCDSCACESVSGALAKEAEIAVKNDQLPNMEICGDLLADCWTKISELCESYNLFD